MLTKVCTKCDQEKPVDEFNWKVKTQNRRQSICKTCHASYRRQHYLDNRAKYIAKAKRWNEENEYERRAHIRIHILAHLQSHLCVDCGETDPVVLEFDHVRGKKVGSVSQLLRAGASLQKIMSEINKCEVRCANCHKRRTAQQYGWWSLKTEAKLK